jgi:hypothetical protein
VYGFPFHWPDPIDHAIALVVNAYKDQLRNTHPWSLADLGRLVGHASFDADAFAQRAREARVRHLAWEVADFLARRGDGDWARVRDRLGPRPPRRLHHWLSQRVASRVLTRLCADAPRDWAVALYYAARIELWKRTDPTGSKLRFK